VIRHAAPAIDPVLALLNRLPPLPQVDLAHSLKVTRLSLSLFDALATPLGIDPRGRELLAMAALWHDSGQALEERAHHKHSYALIMAAPVPWLDPAAQGQVACIARYHRRSLPAIRHAGFAALPEPARLGVCQLAGLLRIADGLDYSHRGLVHDLQVTVADTVEILAAGSAAAEVEIKRAREKADLFAATFKLTLEIGRRA